MFMLKNCVCCGKSILRSSFSEYTYKLGSRVYCGWNCYHKAKIEMLEKKKEAEEKRKKKNERVH